MRASSAALDAISCVDALVCCVVALTCSAETDDCSAMAATSPISVSARRASAVICRAGVAMSAIRPVVRQLEIGEGAAAGGAIARWAPGRRRFTRSATKYEPTTNTAAPSCAAIVDQYG